LEDKLKRLDEVGGGLSEIHIQGLVHRDLHSGNILSLNTQNYNYGNKVISRIFDIFCISDLGLSCPANYQKEEGKIFGVLPYVAPEVLVGKPYTQKSDIYSWGIIAYEFFANSCPYSEMDDNDLIIGVCFSKLRPNIDKVPIPKLLKDLIERC